jgi:hypothetical protein
MGMPDILGMGPGGPEGEGPEVEAEEEEVAGGPTNVSACANAGCDNNADGQCKLESISVTAGGECADRTNEGEGEGMGAVPEGPALTTRPPVAPPPAPGRGGF